MSVPLKEMLNVCGYGVHVMDISVSTIVMETSVVDGILMNSKECVHLNSEGCVNRKHIGEAVN